MAIRFREADSIAAIAELRQRIAELEIQVHMYLCVVNVDVQSQLHPVACCLVVTLPSMHPAIDTP